MPFLNAATKRDGRTYPGRTWMVRVKPLDHDQKERIMSTRSRRKQTAVAIEAWLKDLRHTGDALDVLAGVLDGTLNLLDAYRAHQQNRLASYVKRRRAAASDVDLEPYLAEWYEEIRQPGSHCAGSADKYLAQVRTLIPEGQPFPRSAFTQGAIAKWLKGLSCSLPTRNRYKAAASSFARYLKELEVIPANPVKGIRGHKERPGRDTHYERADAQRLIAALEQPYAALEALMCGAGLEWQAVARLRVRDVNLDACTVEARGSKTKHRSRTTRIVPENAWTIPYIRPAVVGREPDALVFPDAKEGPALASHRAALKALKLKDSTLHDHRHTHAVQLLRDGYSYQIAAKQLGHKDATQVITRYGKYDPDADDYTPRVRKEPTPGAKPTGEESGEATAAPHRSGPDRASASA
ncbi:MAG TPA: site-specific integrase [Gemmatimonadaceae bacterium]|nr:site-specific integrase [Gemmatimonadaceae bacterium]